MAQKTIADIFTSSVKTNAPYIVANFYNGSAVVYDAKIHILGGGKSGSTYKIHYS